MKKLLIALTLTIACSLRMLAINAFPERITFHQPDSKIDVDIFLKGDEKVHWAETLDGYALLHGKNGAFYYATPDGKGGMTVSDYIATQINERSDEVIAFLSHTPKHLLFSQQQVDELRAVWNDISKMRVQPKTMTNVIGEKKFLVVLFAFNDKAFEHSKREFENLFNQVNYNANRSTGSVRDYYYDVSGGLFNLQVDIVGPYTGDSSTAFYGNHPDQSTGYQRFAEEAAAYAATQINFDDYDNDNDGHIDGMHIIFAGKGEEATGVADQIWSHKWNIFSSPQYNNTIVDVYSCSPECSGGNSSFGEESNLTAIGVICHELGHVFGAPDYYDTDYAQSGGQYPGLGNWDIMSGGSWNNSGKTPCHHNAYTKLYIYNWATCDTLTSPEMVTMQPVANSLSDYHRVNTTTNGDFFIIENRQKTKWDLHIPGHGMIVYHVHPNARGARVENYRHPQQIYILAHTLDTLPNSNVSSYGSLGMASYPGEMRRTDINDFTTPSFRPWSNAHNNSPISYISENDQNKTVSFCFKGASPESRNFTAHSVSNDKIRLDWDNYGSMKALIIASENDYAGTPQNGVNYRVGDTLPDGGIVVFSNTSNSAFARDLQNGTHYYFKLYNKINDTTYSATALYADATTSTCDPTEWRDEDFETFAAGALPQCWEGDWEVRSEDGNTRLHADYDNTISVPEPCTFYAAPCSFPDSLSNVVLSFKYGFINCDEENSLTVLYRSNPEADWQEVKTFNNSSEDFDSIAYIQLTQASSYTLFGFRFNKSNSADMWIDDITLLPGILGHSTHNEGGEIDPCGYNVFQDGDSIYFRIYPEPGHKYANFYIDGERSNNKVKLIDSVRTYIHVVRKAFEIRATFAINAGIDEASAQTSLLLYPNPTTGSITISQMGDDAKEVLVFNIQGQVVMRQHIGGESLTLDLSPLPAGLYLLKAGSQKAKIIKQ